MRDVVLGALDVHSEGKDDEVHGDPGNEPDGELATSSVYFQEEVDTDKEVLNEQDKNIKELLDIDDKPAYSGIRVTMLALHVLTMEIVRDRDWLMDLYTKVKIGKKDYKTKLPDFNGDLHVTRQEPDVLSAVNGL